ncbi:Tab2/Atab2 family RNA-binding protein [Cyanobacterium aponinum AL20118]|uniref:Tab2/Atab2 family RNA-binding protein n=1 Tax=Cyanobacterium aponinum AL20115 TaxID=3090662 RepID=A0AAF1C1P2_9CHRO|nr:Tab2/Atab2 family RNA-binding protein [Cyanobacterium aponinum]MBD2392655.1 Tab2/Atab2 family RNA-binding protein [Cyanobacterium aponinum FACHB-4101]WPF87863.1 Tab2/Atab2 family RNA-binding protein [Cyanobacterium aponinum AL20115]
MGKIWELDFYSRPIIDENNKKRWEILICESPTTIDTDTSQLFRYSQFCANTEVNSITLQNAIATAIEKAGETPSKIRFFRRQMNNMILKGCEDAGIPALASRHTYTLNQWLEERMTSFYPLQEGYDDKATIAASVQYPQTNPVNLPDALKGDKKDKWALVSLNGKDLEEMPEWDIGFREAFPLKIANISPDTKIPGLIIFSSRALPLAGWMSGLELGYLRLDRGKFPSICLETGVSDSWILVNLTDKNTLSEAEGFENTKKQANGVHFLAIQSSPESQSFEAFWLLLEQSSNNN